MLEKYESKQQRIRRDTETVWRALSDFNNFTPLIEGRVEGWTVSGDDCSFRVKGLPIGLRMVEKVPGKLIKIEAADSSPLGFTFWVQLKDVGNCDGSAGGESGGESGECDVRKCAGDDLPDTRLRLVLHAEMNMMIKMMVGGKLQGALDEIAAGIAKAFDR